MPTDLRFLGAAGYEIVSPSHRVLVDPFLSANPLAPCAPDDLEAPDVILVTHSASDHLGDTAAIARRTGAPVVCGGDVRLLLLAEGIPEEQVRATIWGVVVEVAGLVVRPVECHHWSMSVGHDGRPLTGTPLAFIVEPEPGIRLYHYGDSAIFDMRLIGELYGPTIGLLGCTQPAELAADIPGAGTVLTGEMTPDEAARVAEMLALDVAVACHYLGRTPDVDEFLERVPVHDSTGQRVAIAPEVGETVVLERGPGGRVVVAGERADAA